MSRYARRDGKKVTISFRLPKNIYDVLHTKASEEGISLNALVSRILARYVNWGLYAEKFRFVTISKQQYRALLSSIDDERVSEIAHELGSALPIDTMLMLWQKVDRSSVLSFMELFCGAGTYEAFEHKFDGKHRVTIRHDIGEKFSLYLREYLTCMLKKVLGKTATCMITPTSVSIEFY